MSPYRGKGARESEYIKPSGVCDSGHLSGSRFLHSPADCTYTKGLNMKDKILVKLADLDEDIQEREYPDERGFVPMPIAKERMSEIEKNDNEFFWGVLMPTLYDLAIGGPISFEPNIAGCLLSIGVLFNVEQATRLFHFFNS